MLGEYLAAGGPLYGLRPEEITVDGRASDLLEQWEHRFEDNCRWFPDRETLVAAVLRRVPARLKFDSQPDTGLAHMRRVEGDTELFVVVNSSSEPLDSGFEMETTRDCLYELDPPRPAPSTHWRRRGGQVISEQVAARGAGGHGIVGHR